MRRPLLTSFIPSSTMPSISVLIALRRIGPYHHARLAAAHASGNGGRGLAITALETRPRSQEYAWEYSPPADYPIERLADGSDPEADPPTVSLDRQLAATLDRHRPQVVITVGWADRSYRRLMLAAFRRRLPLVIVSDSRRADAPRHPHKELAKRLLLRNYSAALVAGSESRAYIECLGFTPEAIAQPWDVIDNALFSNAFAMATNWETNPARLAVSVPAAFGKHFLCVSRFIPEKNLPMLLKAYGAYQEQGGQWGLRILGGGELEPELRCCVASLPVPGKVELAAFEQLEDVVVSYGRASALVLASQKDTWGLAVNEAMAAGLPVLVSTACGCCVDLVEQGVSGWSFDPHNVSALTALLHQAEWQTPTQRQAMVQAARDRLAAFSPEAFATGLAQAAGWALRHPRHSRSGAALARLLSGVNA